MTPSTHNGLVASLLAEDAVCDAPWRWDWQTPGLLSWPHLRESEPKSKPLLPKLNKAAASRGCSEKAELPGQAVEVPSDAREMCSPFGLSSAGCRRSGHKKLPDGTDDPRVPSHLQAKRS